MWITTLLHHPVPHIQWGVVLCASLLAAVIDVSSRRIPNVLTIPLFLSGLVTAGVFSGVEGVVDSLLAGLLLALPYVLLYAFAGGGAGDAKMMGAIGAWLGITLGAIALVLVSLAGVLLGVIFACGAGRFSALALQLTKVARAAVMPAFGIGSFRSIPAMLPDPAKGQTMPYGLAILLGVFASFGIFFLWIS